MGLRREFLWGAEGVGGEAGRLWQVAEEAEGGRGAPSAPPGGKLEGVDLPSFDSGFPGSSSFSTSWWACGGPWSPGSGGGCRSSCNVSVPTGSGGQHVLLNLAGHLVQVQPARDGAFHVNPQVSWSAGHTLSREVLENFATVTAAQTRIILPESPRGVKASVCSSIMRCFHLCSFTNTLELTLRSRARGLKGREQILDQLGASPVLR